MLSAIILAATLAAGPSCADPAIVAANANFVGSNGSINTYDAAVTVKNLGARAQSASLLQSVEVFQNAIKSDQKSISPLGSGASQTVHYRLQRSVDAGTHTTQLRFVLVAHDPHGAPVTNCSTANDAYRITV